MYSRIFIVLMLVAMIASLVMAGVYIYRDRGKGTRAAKALSWRIGIWVVLFLVLVIGIGTGLIKPSNTLQPRSQEQPATSNGN